MLDAELSGCPSCSQATINRSMSVVKIIKKISFDWELINDFTVANTDYSIIATINMPTSNHFNCAVKQPFLAVEKRVG